MSRLRARCWAMFGMMLALRFAAAEDMQLRAQAVQILNAAQVANSIRGGPHIIRTEADFTATGDAGALVSGSYVRTRGSDGSLRQEVRFGDWQATAIFVGNERGFVGPWNYPPYAVRKLLMLVPFRAGQFDEQDVVRAIRDSSYAGHPATCIDYDTVRGEEKSANELCVSKTDGSLLGVHEGKGVFEYSKYAEVAGARYPQHIDYREGTDFSFSVDLKMSKLDSLAEDTFTIPPGAQSGTLCKTASSPVPLRAPQPEGKGKEDTPVTTVVVRVFVTSTGAVSQPKVVKPGRSDLDDMAVKLVQTWSFQPATCNGRPNTVPSDLAVHFQGW